MLKKYLLSFPWLLLFAALVSCGSDSKQPNRTDVKQNPSSLNPKALAANRQANGVIQFEAVDITGQRYRSNEWIGKQPVVLNFWGTWCGPCRREVPGLVQLYNEFSPKGIMMIGLAVNDTPARIKKFTQQYHMSWLMLMADRNILIKYRVATGIPQTIFLDKNGHEVKRFIGSRSYETLKKGFEAIL